MGSSSSNAPIKVVQPSASTNVVNYNINVHNITIQHISGQQRPQQSQPNTSYSNIAGNSVTQVQARDDGTTPHRVNSVDVISPRL